MGLWRVCCEVLRIDEEEVVSPRKQFVDLTKPRFNSSRNRDEIRSFLPNLTHILLLILSLFSSGPALSTLAIAPLPTTRPRTVYHRHQVQLRRRPSIQCSKGPCPIGVEE